MTAADMQSMNYRKDLAAHGCIGGLRTLISELNWTVEFGGVSQTMPEFRDRLRSMVDRMQSVIAEFDKVPSSLTNGTEP